MCTYEVSVQQPRKNWCERLPIDKENTDNGVFGAQWRHDNESKFKVTPSISIRWIVVRTKYGWLLSISARMCRSRTFIRFTSDAVVVVLQPSLWGRHNHRSYDMILPFVCALMCCYGGYCDDRLNRQSTKRHWMMSLCCAGAAVRGDSFL